MLLFVLLRVLEAIELDDGEIRHLDELSRFEGEFGVRSHRRHIEDTAYTGGNKCTRGSFITKQWDGSPLNLSPGAIC